MARDTPKDDDVNDRAAEVHSTSRRRVISATGAAASGSVTGCVGNQEGNRQPTERGTHSNEIVEPTDTADQHSGGWTTDVDAAGHALTNLGQLNSAVYISEGESLNAVVADLDGPAYVVLPAGEVRFEDSITNPEHSLAIVGPGKDVCTVRADGVSRFATLANDRPNVSVRFEGFTLDMDGVPGDGRTTFWNADLSALEFVNVRIVNVGYEEGLARTNGIVQVGPNGYIGRATFCDGFEVDFRTFSTFTDQVRHYVFNSHSEGRQGRLVVDESTRIEGDHFHDKVEGARCRGFAPRINEFGYVHGTYRRLDNYAAQIYLQTDRAVGHAAGLATHVGHGDVWEIRGQAGGVARFSCTVGGHDPERDGNPDRGFVVKDGPDVVHLDDVTISGVLVGGAIRGAEIVTGTASFHNCGHGRPEGRPAFLLRDDDAEVGKVNVKVHILTDESEVYLDPAIEVRDTDGHGYRDGTIVIEGTMEGYEETAVDDADAPEGVTIDTARLFDDGPA